GLRLGHGGEPLPGAVLSPDARWIATFGHTDDGEDVPLTILDAATGRAERTFTVATLSRDARFSADGKFFVTPASRGQAVVVYDVAEGKEVRRFDLDPAVWDNRGFALSADGSVLAAASREERKAGPALAVHAVKTGKLLAKVETERHIGKVGVAL